MAKVDELKTAIAGFKKQIENPNSSASMKGLMEKALVKAEAELSLEEDKVKEDKLTGEKTGEKKAGEDKPSAKAAKPAAPKKEKKAKPAKQKEEEKKEEKEEPEFIVVKGVKYNMAVCDELYAAVHARKERDKETNKKTKTKSPGEKAEKAIESATEKVTAVIPEETIEQHPEKVIKALEKFEKDSEKAVLEFCKSMGVSKTLTDKLAHAYATVIDPIVKEIEEEIAKKK